MTWKHLLNSQRVKAHSTTTRELDDLRTVVVRDLRDAKLEALSTDRRFATAYNAVLQLARMVISCSGYRVVGAGHHQTTFDALQIALPKSRELCAYFDRCRQMRNRLDYDLADVVTEDEVRELITRTEEFRELVESWIARKQLKR